MSALAPLVCLLVTGCAGLLRSPTMLPVRHTLVLGQLVVYSDFTLPPHHRLLDELAAERGDLLATLRLPASDEPIHVYLFDSQDQFHRFLKQHYPDFPSRRAFFVETDTRLVVYAHWGDRVAEDLRHEVAHGYLHSAVPGLPLWLDEGLAEYAEVPRGNRGLNRPHIKLLQTQEQELGWRPNLERLEQLSSATEMTLADYAESWAWTHWLLEGGPERRDMLCNYLQDLRRHGAAPPLSVLVKQSYPAPEVQLAAHVEQVRQDFQRRPATAVSHPASRASHLVD